MSNIGVVSSVYTGNFTPMLQLLDQLLNRGFSASLSITNGTPKLLLVDANEQSYVLSMGTDAVINYQTVDVFNGSNPPIQKIATQSYVDAQVLTKWLVKSADYTASAFDKIIGDTTGGSWTLTLPSNSSNGDFIYLTCPNECWITNNLILDPNGSTIQGYSDTINVDVGPSLTLMYFNGNWSFQ